MKFKFKIQQYQTDVVDNTTAIFIGQPNRDSSKYHRDLGIELSAKIEEKDVNGKKVFFVDGTYLIATFDTGVNESTVTEIAKMKPQYFVMRDASAANDNVLDNFEQIFKHYSPDTIRKIL